MIEKCQVSKIIFVCKQLRARATQLHHNMAEQDLSEKALSNDKDKIAKSLEDVFDQLDRTVHYREEELLNSTEVPISDREKLSMDLENMLDQLDKKVEEVVSQIALVRKTREELESVTKSLQENLRMCEVNPDIDEEHEKKIQTVSSDIKKREEIVKALEKKEILLSHSILASINDWVQELAGEREDLSCYEGTMQEHHMKTPEPVSEEVLECPLTMYKDAFIIENQNNEEEQPCEGKPENVCKVVKKRAPSPPKNPTTKSVG